jgi:hypothetical protein
MQAVKGMVQVAGTTYRVVRVAAGQYEVFRLLDDQSVGSFRCAPRLEVTSTTLERAEMTAIARTAVHSAKTSWVGRLLPV